MIRTRTAYERRPATKENNATLTRVVQLYSSPGLRLIVQLDQRAKKPLVALFSKTNSQFSLPLTILSRNDRLPCYMLKYKSY
jgi:hypothetical protein